MELTASRDPAAPPNLPIHLGPPDQTAVLAYSDRGAESYEDPDNLSFLYGAISRAFLEAAEFRPDDRFVADVGCGTGFAFDVLGERFLANDMVGIGVDPAPGMLRYARSKYRKVSRFRFLPGEFGAVPVPDASVDRVISTLALHWVKDLDAAAAELRRVIKDDGIVEILMIANDDGFVFKKAVLAALRKHLTFTQVLKAATLVQRVRAADLEAIFAPHFDGFEVSVSEHREEASGTCEDHIKWWRARSMPVVSEIADVDAFIEDLRAEVRAMAVDGLVPFDAAFLKLRIAPAGAGADDRGS